MVVVIVILENGPRPPLPLEALPLELLTSLPESPFVVDHCLGNKALNNT
jgi:hypothetical protein